MDSYLVNEVANAKHQDKYIDISLNLGSKLTIDCVKNTACLRSHIPLFIKNIVFCKVYFGRYFQIDVDVTGNKFFYAFFHFMYS